MLLYSTPTYRLADDPRRLSQPVKDGWHCNRHHLGHSRALQRPSKLPCRVRRSTDLQFSMIRGLTGSFLLFARLLGVPEPSTGSGVTFVLANYESEALSPSPKVHLREPSNEEETQVRQRSHVLDDRIQAD